MKLIDVLISLITEVEDNRNNLSIKGGRGYSAGTVYPDKTVGVLKLLGHEDGQEEEDYILKPVQVSKAFKKEKKW